MKSKPIHIAILGASGFGAGELLRLLTQHPAAEVTCITSRGDEALEKLHPHLRGFYPELRVSESVDLRKLLDAEFGVVISAQPHGDSAAALQDVISAAQSTVGSKFAERLRCIDLSGDLRLKDAGRHEQYYPETAALTELRAAAVYGLPELNRIAIRTARVVTNPGCLATAAILAAAPLMTREFRGSVAIDAKTGSSGSGRGLKETTHHPTRHADFRAYKPLAHQHEPEILQAWGDPHGERIAASFVAQSMDVSRGIFATVHATLPETTTITALRKGFQAFYEGSPFVRIVDDSPTLQDVVGSNFCDLGLAVRGRQVIAMCALDNLVKGMAGAAIQNLNLMCKLDETTGLWVPSLRPV